MISLQRRFLLLLAEIEKSQPEQSVICVDLEFSQDHVLVRVNTRNDEQVLPLVSDSEKIRASLEGLLERPVEPRNERADEYPRFLDLAQCWAELHYDLGRTSYLDELDSSIRYEYIRLVDGRALIAVSAATVTGLVVVTVPLDQEVAPLHVADEIADALSARRRIAHSTPRPDPAPDPGGPPTTPGRLGR